MNQHDTLQYKLDLYKQFKTVVRIKLTSGRRVIGIIENILSQVVLVNEETGKAKVVPLCHIHSVKVNQNNVTYRVKSLAKVLSKKIFVSAESAK